MSKKVSEKIKEIVKQHTPKYEYYTPDTPIQKMIKEEKIKLNCHDKGSNSKHRRSEL